MGVGDDKQTETPSVGPIGSLVPAHHLESGRRSCQRAGNRGQFIFGDAGEGSARETTDRLLRIRLDDHVGSLGAANMRRGLRPVADAAVLLQVRAGAGVSAPRDTILP